MIRARMPPARAAGSSPTAPSDPAPDVLADESVVAWLHDLARSHTGHFGHGIAENAGHCRVDLPVAFEKGEDGSRGFGAAVIALHELRELPRKLGKALLKAVRRSQPDQSAANDEQVRRF